MKKILICLIAITAIIMSCKKQQAKSQKMTYEQLTKEIGAENALKVFDLFGLTEADPAARGAKKPKPGTSVETIADLTLDVSAASPSIIYSTSENARWGGCQRFFSLTSNDGAYAIWSCGRFWQTVGTAPDFVTCSDTHPVGTSYLRAFTADHPPTYLVHLSEKVTINN